MDQTRHIYLSSSNQVLEERVDAGTTAFMQNVWGLMYIDGLVLRDRDTDGSGSLDERRYCLQDANWNTVALVDTNGDVPHRFCYQPFGICQFLNVNYGTSNNTSNWTTLFTGRELDSESGLYYFRARYLSGLLGAFLKKDPIGYAESENLYAYTLNNPISWIDPSGLQVFFAGPPPIFIFEQHPWYYEVVRAPTKFDDIIVPKGTPPQPTPQPSPTGGMSGPKGGSFQPGPPAGTLYPPPTGTQSGTGPQGSPGTSYNPQFPDSPGLERFKADRKSRGCPPEEAYECHHIIPQALFNPRWGLNLPQEYKNSETNLCCMPKESHNITRRAPGGWYNGLLHIVILQTCGTGASTECLDSIVNTLKPALECCDHCRCSIFSPCIAYCKDPCPGIA